MLDKSYIFKIKGKIVAFINVYRQKCHKRPLPEKQGQRNTAQSGTVQATNQR